MTESLKHVSKHKSPVILHRRDGSVRSGFLFCTVLQRPIDLLNDPKTRFVAFEHDDDASPVNGEIEIVNINDITSIVPRRGEIRRKIKGEDQ